MRVFRTAALAIIMTFLSVPAFSDMWRTYQNVNNILDMAVDGDTVWIAVKNVGVLQWSQTSGRFVRHTVSTGFPDNQVNRIFKDSKGRIWIPNVKGLSCLVDGQWKFYNGQDGLTPLYVTSITEDKAGVLWFATEGQGVWSYDGSAWERYWTNKWEFLSGIRAVLPVAGGEVLFGRNGGISRFDGRKGSVFATQDSGLVHNGVYALVRDSGGRIWAGTYLGLSVLEDGKWRTVEGTHQKGQINDLSIDPSGTIWMVTYNHIKKVVDGKAVPVEYGGFTSIAIDSSGVKWFGSTQNGVLRLEGDTRTWYRQGDNGPAINVINDLTLDRDGVLWVATSNGVSRFDGREWTRITSLGASTIAADQTGRIWIGAEGGGLYVYHDGIWESHTKIGPYDITIIRSIKADDSGNVWLGMANGLILCDDRGWQLYSHQNLPPGNSISRVFVDSDNLKWIIYPTGTICSYDGIFWKMYGGSKDGLGTHELRTADVDSQGLKWLIYGGALYTFDENAPQYSRLIRYSNNSIPLGTYFQDLVIDSHDVKWLITNKGIGCLDGQKWTQFSKNDGLPDSTISRIVLADDGSVWAGSALGVAHLENGYWKKFSISQNCPASNAVYSSALDSAGRKWFGTAGGVSCYSQGQWTNFPPESGLEEGTIVSLAIGGDGAVWAGHHGFSSDSRGFYGGGVSRYYEGRWTTTYKNKNIDALATDRDGVVWMAYSGSGYPFEAGIAFYRDGQWHTPTLPDDFEMNRCFAIAVDRNNIIWFGLWGVGGPSRGAILSYDRTEFTRHANPDMAYLLNRGSDDSIWFISPNGLMLNRYDGATWKSFAPPYIFGEYGKNSTEYGAGERIPAYGRLISAETDAKGCTWFSTRSGLVRFDGFNWSLYPKADEFTLEQAIETITVDRDNTLWIGTTKGIVNYSLSVGVEEDRALPAALVIANFPNPFNLSTVISFTLPSAGKASVSVYDITGRRVRELISERVNAGSHSVVWDGTDTNGETVASGIYFTRVVCGSRIATGKMLLMK